MRFDNVQADGGTITLAVDTITTGFDRGTGVNGLQLILNAQAPPTPPAITTPPQPTVVAAVGTKPKRIEEYAGRVNSGHTGVSVARMVSPEGWEEPGQRPEFEEITVVLRGMLRVDHDGGALDVRAGQAIVAAPGEWVRYSTPAPEGAEYIAVCVPGFSPATVHRDSK